MTEELTIYVDYIGNQMYGVFVNDPLKDEPDFIQNSVTLSLKLITRRFGIDTHVEVSHCAEIIFKIENDVDMDSDLT